MRYWAQLISFADVTGDKVVEVVVAGGSSIDILEGRRLDVLEHLEPAEQADFYPNAVIADQNQDGVLDLVTGKWGQQALVSFALEGASSFAWASMGGAGTYHGEHAPGGVSGGALIGLEAIRNRWLEWSDDASSLIDWTVSIGKGSTRA